MLRPTIHVLVFLAYVWPSMSLASTVEPPVYQQAKAALAAKDYSLFDSLYPKLSGNPMATQLLYEKLKQTFDYNDTAALQVFIDKHPESSMAVRLKRFWLSKLAEKKDWAEYVRVYTPVNSVALECDYFYALQMTGRADNTLRYIERRWLTGSSLPNSCTPAFDYWLAHHASPDTPIWQRFSLALNEYNLGLASYLAKKLSSDRKRVAKAILRVYRQPYLVTKKSFTDNETSAEVISYGLYRLARRNPALAIKTWRELNGRFQLSSAQEKRVFQAIGLKMAFKKDKNATKWFRKVVGKDLAPVYKEWLLSSALYHHDWALVKMAVEAMSESERNQPKSRYWYARALEQLGDTQQANSIYQQLATLRNYYGFLACDRLDIAPKINHQALKMGAAEVALVKGLPGFKRAKEYYQQGLKHAARVELYYLMKHGDKKEQYIVTQLVAQWGWASEALRLSAKGEYKEDVHLRFPLKYRQTVMAEAKKHSISPALIYAIIRQESLFTPEIKSHAGAVGLMQLMPTTAKRTSKQYKLAYHGETTLVKPLKNIVLGSAHLDLLHEQLDEHPLLVIASYNAGKNAVSRWLPKGKRSISADIWVESIPFHETRHYLRSVIANHVVYSHRLGLKSNMDDLMQVVR